MLLATSVNLFAIAVGDQLITGAAEVFRNNVTEKESALPTRQLHQINCGQAADDLRKRENAVQKPDDALSEKELVDEPKYPAAHNVGLSFDRLDLVDGRWISAVAVSPSGKYIAVANNFKNLLLYRLETNGATPSLHRTWSLSKRSMAMCFSSDETCVIVADKLGDAFVFRIQEESGSSPSLILGHISVITDVCISADDKFVLTSDRDEKVRVSHFPLADDIQAFCLGNTSFVTRILIPWPDQTVVLSAGGDGTIRAFNYMTGKQIGLYCQQFPADPVSDVRIFPSSLDFRSEDNVLLVGYHGTNTAMAFKLVYSDSVQEVVFQELATIKLKAAIRDLKFCGNAVVAIFNDQTCPLKSFENLKAFVAGVELPLAAVSRMVKDQVEIVTHGNRSSSLFFDPFLELYSTVASDTASLPDSTVPAAKKPRIDEVLI